MRTNDYIEVSRAVVTSTMDLGQILTMIHTTAYDSFQKFGAQDRNDIWVQEVYMGYVVVKNEVTGKYYSAEYGVDDSGNILMDNVREVAKMWVPVGDGEVQRKDKDITMPVYYKHSKSFWGNVVS